MKKIKFRSIIILLITIFLFWYILKLFITDEYILGFIDRFKNDVKKMINDLD